MVNLNVGIDVLKKIIYFIWYGYGCTILSIKKTEHSQNRRKVYENIKLIKIPKQNGIVSCFEQIKWVYFERRFLL